MLLIVVVGYWFIVYCHEECWFRIKNCTYCYSCECTSQLEIWILKVEAWGVKASSYLIVGRCSKVWAFIFIRHNILLTLVCQCRRSLRMLVCYVCVLFIFTSSDLNLLNKYHLVCIYVILFPITTKTRGLLKSLGWLHLFFCLMNGRGTKSLQLILCRFIPTNLANSTLLLLHEYRLYRKICSFMVNIHIPVLCFWMSFNRSDLYSHTFINMHACVLHLNKLFVCAHVCLYYCIVDAFSHKVCKELILGLLITSPNRNNLNLWCLFREWSMIRHAHTSASFIRILHQSCPHPSWHDLQISFMQIFHFKTTFRIHKFLSFLAWPGKIS